MSHEGQARLEKALAIADVVEPATRGFTDEDVELLRLVPLAVRLDVAEMVGKAKPSDQTWQQAIDLVQKRRAGAALLASALRNSLRVVERKGA